MKTQDGLPVPTLIFLENVKVKKNQSLEEIVKRESEKPRQPSQSGFSAVIHEDKIEFSAGKSRKKVPIKEILYEHIERILPDERKLRVALGCMTDKRRNVCSFQFTDYGAYSTFMYRLYEARGWIIESERSVLSTSSFKSTKEATQKSSETAASVEYIIQSPAAPMKTDKMELKTSYISWESVQEPNDVQVQADSVDPGYAASSLSECCECCGWNARRVYAHENTRPTLDCDTVSILTCSCGRNTRQLPQQARQTQTSRPPSPARPVERQIKSSSRNTGAADGRQSTSRDSLDSPTLYVQIPNKHPSPYEEVLPEFDQVKVYRARPKITSPPQVGDVENSQSRTTYRKISTGAPSSGYSSATMLTDNLLELTVSGQNHGEYISDKSVYVKQRSREETGRLVCTKDPSVAPPLRRY
ncbi:hypothetical protein AAHC03_01372 [Spirometra sp. Aus1]|nr:unnamed protein product [Spirometra erinaceieuropaei]